MTTKEQLHLSPRPELDRYQEYKPGLSIQEIERQYGLREVIKLASNENPLGSSPMAMSAYKKAVKELFRYPESKSIDLRRVISDRYKLGIENIIMGNGSDEIIELLAKAFLTPKDEIVVSESTFLQYKIASDLMGAQARVVPMKGMKADLDGMQGKVNDKTKFIFIANPNNPTGTFVGRDELRNFLKNLPGHVVPVIDEAYFEYARTNEDYPSVIHEFFGLRPVIVLRTFSKAYGLAGLRVGYGVAPEAVVRQLDKIRPPFNVSVPAQHAAMAALGDAGFIEKTVETNQKEKAVLVDELLSLGLNVVPSVANFVLFEVKPAKGRAVFEKLLRKGIVARSVDEYGLPYHLRVTVGTKSENKKFIKALREVIETK